jgi:hypothetical protein
MFGKPQISPELLMSLGGGIMSGQNLSQGLGQGFQNASNIMAVQKQEREIKEGENKTRAFVQKMFPTEDVANMPPEMLKMYATQAIQQRFAKPEKAEFKQLDDGTYGSWDGSTFNKLGTAPKPVDLPAIAKEYEWAKQNGFTGSPQEYQAWKANLSKTGMTVEYDPVNGFRMTQGSVDGNKPVKMTEQQSKDINFLTRAKKAEEQLAPLENELTSWAQKRMTGLPFDAGNYLKSPEYQQAEQAGREILAIILRKDTGAAVTKEEFETYSEIYLPQPGEGPEKIAAKRKSRETAIRAIQAGLGPLAPADEQALPNKSSQPIPAEEYFKSP